MPNVQETTALEAASLNEPTIEGLQSPSPAREPGELQPFPAAEEALKAESKMEEDVPEKFRGKSVQEIIKSYQGLEGKLGQLGSEKSHKEREAEELRMRLHLMEQHMLSLTPQRQVVREDSDPLAGFEKQMEENPQDAMKRLADNQRRLSSNLDVKVEQRIRERDAVNFYERQKQENPDFAVLEPDMVRLSQQYAHIVRPEYLNSPETIQILHGLAKAKNMQRYVSEAVEKASKSQSAIKEEKRKAFSESAFSQGSQETSRPFSDLSLEEMRKELGIIDK